ncbi:MAG: phytanoyl-CoA dioxygenase family protein [Capsulimonadales bacterium]|nr:phytanoyl-CoA dioxygenase family protein [Capsulimonadales bacterium]
MTTMPITPEDPVARFEQDGYAVVRGLFAPEEVAELRDTFTDLNANGPIEGLSEILRGKDGYTDSDPLSFYPRMMHPHRHLDKPVGPLALRRMLDARLYPLLKAFMQDEPAAVQSMFYFKPAGARGQDLHQDNFYLRVKPGTCCAMWLAVDDADEENGGMVVVPGTHDMEVVCPEPADKTEFFTDHHVDVPEGKEAVPVRLKAGDVLFFNGSVIHGSYANRSKDRFRRAFICHYVPASSAELSHWYVEPQLFDGTTIEIPEATGGGPCGRAEAGIRSPH